ncbi:unnamed protein product [Mytilus coruscus]|uniref:Integrase catalytic domain-containing protein n=1 Tax=Mytilus coruscus TaxID=42192 RepID=A0A6J8E507_MYTCO|nr:unnamed protein product [Mytilus coruscus]
MLSMYCAKDQAVWNEYLPQVLLAYRSSVHSTTGFTPNFLTFGREVTLPLQAVIPMPSPAQDYTTCKEDFVINLQNRLQTVHELARKNLKNKVQYQKKYYDEKSNKRMFTGWKEGTRFDGPPGEELFQPVYSGDEPRAASSSSMDMDITKPEAWRITYVALVPQSIMAEAVFGKETYRFAIADTLLTDVKYVSALTRRMLAITQGGKQSAGRKHKLLGKTYSDRVTLAVKLLGLPEKYITNIHRLESDFYTLPSRELFASPTKNPVILKKKSSLKPTISAKKSSKISSTVAKKPEKPSIKSSSSNTPTTAPVTFVPSSPKTSSLKPSTPPTTPAVTSCPLATISNFNRIILTSYATCISPAKKPKISSMTIPYTPEKPTQPGPTYISTPKQLLATITTEDIPSVELRTPAERATSLFRISGMPLFPPARRDWTGEVQVKLSGDVLTKDWPPQGWKDMTEDTRKLKWEFIAFQYEQVSNNTTVPSRAGLLDKYNVCRTGYVTT